jgi:glyoxylase-like metal-dependent hydrolase (beta-lactamase superfamily II)
MGFEAEYLPVGNGEKSGDAILVRFGNLHGNRDEFKIAVIDGGTLDSGQTIVNHILEHYGTDNVDYVFSTHLDIDHISGLRIVIEKMNVSYLFTHRPIFTKKSLLLRS